MDRLSRSWLIMVSLCTILHGHGILAKIMARSWQDLGKASKELAMDLGKGTMASNTGMLHIIQMIYRNDLFGLSVKLEY